MRNINLTRMIACSSRLMASVGSLLAGVLLLSALAPLLWAAQPGEPLLVPESVRQTPEQLDHQGESDPGELLVPVLVATSSANATDTLRSAEWSASPPEVSQSAGGNYRLVKQVFGAGGESVGTRFRLLGTVAEVGAGESSSSRFSLVAGFHPLPYGLGTADLIFCHGFEAAGCP